MEQTHAPAAWHDLTLSIPEVVRGAKRWILALAAGTLLLFFALWGLPAWPGWQAVPAALGLFVLHLLLFAVVYVASAVLHEGLHAVAIVVFGRVPWRAVRFGLRLREGVAYVHTPVPMHVRAYRGVLLLPGLVQGVLPMVGGLALGNGWLTFYGYVMLVSAAGDFAVLRLLRVLPGAALVRDHPHEVGCQVRYAADPA
jgi:hypothetical protein